MAEEMLGQTAGGLLPNPLKGDIADIVEQDGRETCSGIGKDKRDGQGNARFHSGRHPVDCPFIGERHDKIGRLAQQHEQQRIDDPTAQRWRVSWPEINEETPQCCPDGRNRLVRSEEHTSELQSLMRISYAVFCLKKKTTTKTT